MGFKRLVTFSDGSLIAPQNSLKRHERKLLETSKAARLEEEKGFGQRKMSKWQEHVQVSLWYFGGVS
jgi:hypothetical protein